MVVVLSRGGFRHRCAFCAITPNGCVLLRGVSGFISRIVKLKKTQHVLLYTLFLGRCWALGVINFSKAWSSYDQLLRLFVLLRKLVRNAEDIQLLLLLLLLPGS